jgi:hypothetical protein
VNGQYPDFTKSHYAPIDFGVLEAQYPTFYVAAGFPQSACSTDDTIEEAYNTGRAAFG